MFLHTILLSLTLAGPLNTMPAVGTPVAKTPVAARSAFTPPIISAQGHPMHVDFFNLSGKRADLRLRIASKGLDAAFTQWLQEEKPHAYQHAVGSAMVGVK